MKLVILQVEGAQETPESVLYLSLETLRFSHSHALWPDKLEDSYSLLGFVRHSLF